MRVWTDALIRSTNADRCAATVPLSLSALIRTATLQVASSRYCTPLRPFLPLPFPITMTLIGWSTAVLGLVAFYLLFHFFGPEGDKPTAVAFEDSVPLIDDILAEWKPQLFDAPYEGYRGHCYRVWHFVKALYPGSLTAVQREQLAIALAHHDLGVWSDRLSDGRRNIDYIQPSVDRAVAWLKKHKKPAEWIEPVSLMISEHHKLRAYSGPTATTLVESFRQADLVDFSLGIVRNGLSRALVSSVRTHWPNAGFHPGLVTIIIDRLKTHPLNPFPMMKF